MLSLPPKCLPVILYSREVCPLSKSDLQSLDFVVNSFLMKLFKTNNDIISNCQNFLCFSLPSELLVNAKINFRLNFIVSRLVILVAIMSLYVMTLTPIKCNLYFIIS